MIYSTKLAAIVTKIKYFTNYSNQKNLLGLVFHKDHKKVNYSNLESVRISSWMLQRIFTNLANIIPMK